MVSSNLFERSCSWSVSVFFGLWDWVAGYIEAEVSQRRHFIDYVRIVLFATNPLCQIGKEDHIRCTSGSDGFAAVVLVVLLILLPTLTPPLRPV